MRSGTVAAMGAMLIALAGCRAPLRNSETEAARPRALDVESQVRSDADVLRSDEIHATQASSALDAGRKLRPEFLRPRGRAAGREVAITVYLDGICQGGVGILQTIPAGVVADVTYLSELAARERYGVGNEGPVLAVRTLRAR